MEGFSCSFEERVIIKDAHYIANICMIPNQCEQTDLAIFSMKAPHTRTHTHRRIPSALICRAELWSPLLKMQHSTAFFNVSLFCHKE